MRTLCRRESKSGDSVVELAELVIVVVDAFMSIVEEACVRRSVY